MASSHDLTEWIGRPVTTSDGSPVGRVVDVYLDGDTDQPEWLAVDVDRTGALTYLPLATVQQSGAGAVTVPFEFDHIGQAPAVAGEGILTRDDEAALYRHYGVEGPPEPTDGEGGITRSEEELHVETRTVEAGRVRLRKLVDTEHVSVTVPVQHDEVRVTREAITDDEGVPADAFTEREVEVVLQDDEVVATTVAVPKERVKLETEVVTEERDVEADLRTERVVVDTPTDA